MICKVILYGSDCHIAIIKMFQKTGLMAMGGFAWGSFVEEIKASDLVLNVSE